MDMLQPADVIRILNPTATHNYRFYAAVPTTDPAVTKVVIGQAKSCNHRCYVDTYLVEEDHAEPFPGRSFLFAKQGDAPSVTDDEGGSSNVYRVTLARTPDCSCSGFGRHGGCKHYDTIVDIVEREMPASVFPSAEQVERDSGYDYGYALEGALERR